MNDTPIRVALVDDQPLFSAGLKMILGSQPDLDLVGEATDGEQAVALAADVGPDVMLMDIRMPVMDGITATRRITESSGRTKVIVLTTIQHDEAVVRAIQAGAGGFLTKDATPEFLLATIRTVHSGHGGGLTDAFSWRACFGVNLPLGVMCLVLTAYGVHEQPPRNDAPVLTLKEKVKKVDFFGTLLAVPAITFLLMALQWGGTKFGWGSWQIILPLVVCALLFVAFGYLQYRQGDNALLPPRILKQRSIIAGMWYGACCEGVLAVTEYYMSIYFQGVRGYTPTKAGLLALPMVGGLAIAFIISGVGTTWIGYYYRKYPPRPLNLH